VVKRDPAADSSQLTQLLLEGRKAKEYSRLLQYLRDLSPSRLDAELRAMQVGRLSVLQCDLFHSG
jgi:hypothetical protein